MLLAVITLLVALSISSIAAWYSIVGLTAIFAAAVFPIILMGAVLEVGKITATVWLHQNWFRAPRFTKWYLSIAVILLMFITSMGIFGFLSKSHIEQTAASDESISLIKSLDANITRSEGKVDRWQVTIDGLNKGDSTRVDNLVSKEQIVLNELYVKIKNEKDDIRKDADKKIELQNNRLKQAQERKEADIKAAKDRFEKSFGGGSKYDEAVKRAKELELSVASRVQREIIKIQDKLTKDLEAVDEKYKNDIKAIQDRIQKLRDQANIKTEDIDKRINELESFIDKEEKKLVEWRNKKFEYEKDYRALEAEVGPIKYIAEFIYGDEADRDLLEEAVRWVIIIIVIVFDPLAIMLVLAATMQIKWIRQDKGIGKTTEAKKKKIEELKMKIDDYTKLLEELEKKMDALHESNETKDADIVKLQNKIDKVLKEKDALEERLNKLIESNKDAHEKQLANLKHKLAERDEALSETKEALKKEQGLVKSLESREPEVVEKIVEKEIMIEDEAKIKAAELEKAEMEKQVKARDAAIERLNEKYKLVEAQATNNALAIKADDDDSVPPASFGSKFPEEPVIGQLFTKTDVFPHTLFKWNDKKWIEVDKEGTSSYLTEDYIRSLVEKVASGEIELEDLNDAEKSEMTDFLSNGRE